jgi:hypothetical protein
MEGYIKTIEKHLRKVVASHQRDWDERLPLFLLAYRTSTHDTTASKPASLVFGRELSLHCDLRFGAPPDKKRPTTGHAPDLMDHLHDIHHYAHQHLKPASDRLKTLQVTTRGRKCGFIAQPARRGNRPSLNPRGNAHAR